MARVRILPASLLALLGLAAGLQAAPPLRDLIDAEMRAAWQREKVISAGPAADAAFLRRVYLDLAGTIPTADEAHQFLQNSSPGKRSRLIDRLLDDPRFARQQA